MNSYDGLRDSRTNLASPSLLYEELRRELSRAKRDLTFLTGIRIIISEASEDINATFFETVPRSAGLVAESQIDREILHLCQAMTNVTRGEDICSRMGEREFLIILHGPNLEAKTFMSRIMYGWERSRSREQRLNENSEYALSYASVLSESGDSALDFLNRLDLQSLQVVATS